LSCHAVRVDVEGGALDDTEIDAFMSDRWFITVRKDENFSMEPVLKRWDRSGELASHGVSYLLYGLLDVVVDEYFRAADAFDAYYDRVSEAIFEERPIEPNNQRHWFQMRRALFQFHRLVVPMREVASALLRREHTLVPEELYPYFQDLYDHLLRLTETTDSLRDLVSTIVETNLSLRDYRQNLIVKRVGSWAAIFAVPALITGFYGMNVPYPGSGTHWGFAMSCVLMAVLSAWLYRSFRRRDWI
jgi:magnesium transporter